MSLNILKGLFSVFLFIKTYTYSIDPLKKISYKEVVINLLVVLNFSLVMVILLENFQRQMLTFSINMLESLLIMLIKLLFISVLLNLSHQALCTLILYLKNHAKNLTDKWTKYYLLLIVNGLLLVISYGTVCFSIVCFQKFII